MAKEKIYVIKTKESLANIKTALGVSSKIADAKGLGGKLKSGGAKASGLVDFLSCVGCKPSDNPAGRGL